MNYPFEAEIKSLSASEICALMTLSRLQRIQVSELTEHLPLSLSAKIQKVLASLLARRLVSYTDKNWRLTWLGFGIANWMRQKLWCLANKVPLTLPRPHENGTDLAGPCDEYRPLYFLDHQCWCGRTRFEHLSEVLLAANRLLALKILAYDGNGFWLAQKRLSKGRFNNWPKSQCPHSRLKAHQVYALCMGGDPGARGAPDWRPLPLG